MFTFGIVMVIFILLLLAISGLIYCDVFRIQKLINDETNIDSVKFDKCVFPYER